MNLVNIGFGNLVNADRVVFNSKSESAPVKKNCSGSKSKRQSYRCNAWKKDHECYYNGLNNVVFILYGFKTDISKDSARRLVMSKKGMMVILSAPSGCGKDTVFHEISSIRDDVCESISATTRQPRGWRS